MDTEISDSLRTYFSLLDLLQIGRGREGEDHCQGILDGTYNTNQQRSRQPSSTIMDPEVGIANCTNCATFSAVISLSLRAYLNQ